MDRVLDFFAKPKREKRLGLALGGGAARGLAHLGVLKALEDNAIEVKALSGSSAGCFIGAVYAAGVPIDEMIKRAKKLRWLDFVRFSVSRKSLMSSQKIVSFLKEYIGDMTLKDLKIPFTAIATDLLTGETVSYSGSDDLVTDVIQASISFPGLFKPFYYQGKYLVDAGVGANIPVDELDELGATVKIAVNVIPQIILKEAPKDIKAVMDRSLDLLVSRFSAISMGSADLILNPITKDISSFDLKKAEELIELGYLSVQENITAIKACL